MEKGSTYQTEITGYTSEGAGIARIDGMAVFVPYAVAGELCEIMILKQEKSFAYARLVRVIKPSEERMAPDCPHFPKCGGCVLRHMSYNEELRFKETRVRDAIERISGLDVPVRPIIGAENPLFYRNKAQFPVGENGTSGFYRVRSHDIVASDTCLIQNKLADKIRRIVGEWQRRYNISSYSEKTHKGVLRHIFIRTGEGGAHLCLVAKEKPKETDKLLKMLCENGCPVCGIVLNINRENTNVILGKEYKTLYGSPYMKDKLCGLEFQISPAAFYQVNHSQTEMLYGIVSDCVKKSGAETALDLYCGIGTITLSVAKYVKQIIGVEIVPEAIEDAKTNAELNMITNAGFICADAGGAAKMLAESGKEPDVIIIDPPRKGISQDVIDAIFKMNPKTVVYVSCDPATLARDLKILCAGGYKAEFAQPVDMFPRTKHVETVVLMSRNQ